MNVRDVVFSSLLKYENNKSYPNIEIDHTIEKYGLSGNDSSFFTAMVYGVIEKKITLDYIISKISGREITKIDKEILVILRMGVYQILYMQSVPDYAAVNECVRMCTTVKKKSASSFVNAILRKLVREKDTVAYPDRKKEPVLYLSVAYSFPVWLVDMWVNDYGFERCESILSALCRPTNLTFRVNTLKTSVQNVLNYLSQKGIQADNGIYSNEAVRLLQSCPVSSLDILKHGEVFVQDEASQLCVKVLDVQPGDIVIDTCCCPGGKSFSIAVNMCNRGKVYSFDLHGNKLSLVRKGAEKLGIDIIETREHDGREWCRDFEYYADRVLVDAPCSGLGVISKKPDLKYKEKTAIEKLPDIQYRILDNASKYVKKEGVLVYSTCTLNIRENEQVAEKFLSIHKEFEPFDFDLGKGSKSQKGILTLYPDVNNTDGFFISRFRKK